MPGATTSPPRFTEVPTMSPSACSSRRGADPGVAPDPTSTGKRVAARTSARSSASTGLPVELPVTASGPLTVMVADGTRLAQWEQREARQSQQAQGVAQMVRALNKARKNNTLYVKLLSSDAGAVRPMPPERRATRTATTGTSAPPSASSSRPAPPLRLLARPASGRHSVVIALT